MTEFWTELQKLNSKMELNETELSFFHSQLQLMQDEGFQYQSLDIVDTGTERKNLKRIETEGSKILKGFLKKYRDYLEKKIELNVKSDQKSLMSYADLVLATLFMELFINYVRRSNGTIAWGGTDPEELLTELFGCLILNLKFGVDLNGIEGQEKETFVRLFFTKTTFLMLNTAWAMFEKHYLRLFLVNIIHLTRKIQAFEREDLEGLLIQEKSLKNAKYYPINAHYEENNAELKQIWDKYLNFLQNLSLPLAERQTVEEVKPADIIFIFSCFHYVKSTVLKDGIVGVTLAHPGYPYNENMNEYIYGVLTEDAKQQKSTHTPGTFFQKKYYPLV